MGVSAVTIVVLFDWHDRFTDENKRNNTMIVWGCFGQALLVGAGLGAAGYARNASGLFGEYMGSTADAASLWPASALYYYSSSRTIDRRP